MDGMAGFSEGMGDIDVVDGFHLCSNYMNFRKVKDGSGGMFT